MRDPVVERLLCGDQLAARPVAGGSSDDSSSSGGWSPLGITAVDETSTARSGGTSRASSARSIPSTYVAR